jgi:hypothetical protein
VWAIGCYKRFNKAAQLAVESVTTTVALMPIDLVNVQ